jgi:hypothetical protein
MKVLMLASKKGSPDGIRVFLYESGKEYNLPDRLANIFIAEGWAESVIEHEPAPQYETKIIKPSRKKGGGK